MIYVFAVETQGIDDEGTDEFFNDIDEVANWINDNLRTDVLTIRPLSEIVSC